MSLSLLIFLCNCSKPKTTNKKELVDIGPNNTIDLRVDSSNLIDGKEHNFKMVKLDSDLNNANIIGVWHSSNKYLDKKYDAYLMIYELGGNFYLRRCQISSVYNSRFQTSDDIKLTKKGGKYFRISSATGDFYVLSGEKILYYDNEGIINDYSTQQLPKIPQYKLKRR